MKESVLLKEALFLFDQKIPIHLNDPNSNRAIGPYSEFEPITERKEVVRMCEETPSAKLMLSSYEDSASDLVALGVKVGTWSQNGEDSLMELVAKYGQPVTLAYRLPNGESYYFFYKGTESIKNDYGSGMSFDRHFTVPVYPSMVNGQLVEKIGDGASIQSLSDWFAGNNLTRDTEPSANVGIIPEIVEHAIPEIDDTPLQSAQDPASDSSLATPSTMSIQNDVITAVNNPSISLRGEVSTWFTSGIERDSIISMSLNWNIAQGAPLKIEEVVSLVEELTLSPVAPVQSLAGKELLFDLTKEFTLFHDNLDQPHFFLEGQAFRAPSKQVSDRLKYYYLTETGDLPKKKDLNAVLDIMESKAQFDGARIKLSNRVDALNGANYYDLLDKRYVKVTSDGWTIEKAFPLFRRFNHQQPQVEPVSGGNPWGVFDYLTIDKDNYLLVMVYIISLFVPSIAHPILAVFGDQGSAKSFFCTLINRLVDPTLTERVIQPSRERDLVQTLSQKYLTVLDNLSKIDNRYSDIFCQVCTGGSISLRKLFTDDGENIAQFRHIIILNSISLAIVNADLMDRSIILRLHRINPEDRKPEDALWSAFEAAKPGILGGIFDTVSKAMAIYPTLKTEKLPRLADFAKWGYAIAEALGKSGDQFIEDFSQNVKRQNESVVEKNVLCQAVIQLMSDKPAYHKSVGDAHSALKNIAGEDSRDVTFPKLPHNLRDGLEKLRSTLSEHGISFVYLDRKAKGVELLMTKIASPDTSELPADMIPAIMANNVPYVADVPEDQLPVINFDEMPEVVNG